MCGSKSSKQQTEINYPGYVTSAVQQALGQATTAASTPYNPYGGELVAPLNSVQDAGIAGIAGSVGSAQPYLNQAYGMASNLQPVTPTPYSPGAVQQYESPYTQDVINATQGQFNLSNAQQQQNLVGNAASQHALGGDRVGVAQAQLAGQQDTAQAATIAGLYNQNYQQALGEFNTQQQTGMAAQEANNYTNLYGAGELGNLGQLQLGTGLQGYGALLQAGGLGQQTQQAGDTANYQQYLTGQQYPFQTAQYLANISQGLGGLYTGDKTTTTTQPNNIFGQIAGLGLSAAGLGAFGGGGGGLFGGLFGSSNPYSFQNYTPFGNRGGNVDKLADGGEADDEDDDAMDAQDSEMEAREPDVSPDDEDLYSPTSGFEGASPMAALQGMVANPGPGIVAGDNPWQMGGASNPAQSGGLGLDPVHMLMLQAGAGMMASRSPYFGQQLGEGLQKGLAGYQQERNFEQQMGYRTAMSRAATTRAEALSQHYANADARPKIITSGPTVHYLYPNGEDVDSHLPTAAWKRATDTQDYQKGRLKVESQNANKADYTPVGINDSDPEHPQIIMADRRDPTHQVQIAGTPKTAGGRGGTTTELVQQLIKDGSASNTQDALSIIKDPGGQNGSKLGAAQERLASSAAQHDPAFQDDPVSTMNRWRGYYGAGQHKPQAAPAPGGGHNNAPPVVPAGATPVPPAYKDKPDGYKVWDKQGKPHHKQGNFLVPG